MSKKLQCKECGKAEYNEDLYNYNGETLCRYCIVSKLCETSSNCEYIGICDDKKYNNRTQNLQHQLDQQKAMWNELKEHISNQIIHYDELSDKFKEENNNGCVLLANSKRSMIEEILYKMQELEKGEKDEESIK